MISSIQQVPLYKNKSFLFQKYVVESLSTDEIASQIFSARSTVLKYLKIYGFPIRETGRNIRRRRSLPYGRKIVGRNELTHKRELEAIEKMKRL